MKKFKFTHESIHWKGRTLYRIQALINFGNVSAGDRGGFVESEKNLSHDGDAWVYGNAKVYDSATISGNAIVYGDAEVYGRATVSDLARVGDDAKIYGSAIVCDLATISGNSTICDLAVVGGNSDVCDTTVCDITLVLNNFSF